MARPLSQWEWRVVATALETALLLTNLDARFDAPKIVGAIQQSPAVAWKTTQYGPSPAVSTKLYAKLARWYAKLNQVGRNNALQDIANGSLLTTKRSLWDTVETSNFSEQDAWEGSMQIVSQSSSNLAPYPASECEAIRAEVGYLPVTGEQALKAIRYLQGGAALSDAMQPLLQAAPALFLQRTFLLGVRMKTGVNLAGLLGSMVSLQSASSLFHDVVLVWAPGRGTSLLPYIQAGVSPASVAGLMTTMGADIIGAELGQTMPGMQSVLSSILMSPEIQNALPGLVEQYLGGNLFGPASRKTSGYQVVDKHKEELEKRPDPPLPKGASTVTSDPWSGYDTLLVGSVLATIALVAYLRKRPELM